MRTATITAETTVNEAATHFPATLRVFGAWGIDACCGGAKPMAEVAERHGLDLDALLAELREAAEDQVRSGSESSSSITLVSPDP